MVIALRLVQLFHFVTTTILTVIGDHKCVLSDNPKTRSLVHLYAWCLHRLLSSQCLASLVSCSSHWSVGMSLSPVMIAHLGGWGEKRGDCSGDDISKGFYHLVISCCTQDGWGKSISTSAAGAPNDGFYLGRVDFSSPGNKFLVTAYIQGEFFPSWLFSTFTNGVNLHLTAMHTR